MCVERMSIATIALLLFLLVMPSDDLTGRHILVAFTTAFFHIQVQTASVPRLPTFTSSH